MVFMKRTSWDNKCASLQDYGIMNCELWWVNFCESDICEVLYELSGDPRSSWRSEIGKRRKIAIDDLFESWALLIIEIACLGSGLFLHTLYHNS